MPTFFHAHLEYFAAGLQLVTKIGDFGVIISKNSWMLQLLFGAFMIAWAPILVKLTIGMGPAAIGSFRTFVAFLVFSIISHRELGNLFSQKFYKHQRWLKFNLLAGLFFGLDLTAWHICILKVGAGVATVLANTQVFYLALFALFMKETRFDFRFVVALLLGFLGVGLLFSETLRVNPEQLTGLSLGILTGLFYSGYLICIKTSQKQNPELSTSASLAIASGTSALLMLIFSLLLAETWTFSSSNILNLVALGALVHVVGWLFISKGLPLVNSALAGLILLLQPVFASGLSSIILDEKISTKQYASGALILLAIIIENTRQKNKSPV